MGFSITTKQQHGLRTCRDSHPPAVAAFFISASFSLAFLLQGPQRVINRPWIALSFPAGEKEAHLLLGRHSKRGSQ